MKTTKKVFGVVLALAMILNVFAISSFAAFPDDAACKLIISTDKKSYSAGDDVIVTISEQVLAAVGKMTIGGQYEIAYNSAAITPYSTNKDNLATNHGFVPDPDFAGDGTTTGYNDSGSQMLNTAMCLGNGSSVDPNGASKYGWDSLMNVVVSEFSTGRVAVDCTTAHNVLSYKMKIPSTTSDGTYTIGFNAPGYESYGAFSNDEINTGLYGTDGTAYGAAITNMYEYGTCSFTVGKAASTPVVANGATKIQWANKDNTQPNVNIGFTGTLSGLDLTLTGNEVNEIKEVGVVFSKTVTTPSLNADGSAATGCTKAQTYTLYDTTTAGTYAFRAVVTNVAYTNAETIYAVPYVILSDGTTQYCAATAASATANGLYTVAVAGTMPAYAGA